MAALSPKQMEMYQKKMERLRRLTLLKKSRTPKAQYLLANLKHLLKWVLILGAEDEMSPGLAEMMEELPKAENSAICTIHQIEDPST